MKSKHEKWYLYLLYDIFSTFSVLQSKGLRDLQQDGASPCVAEFCQLVVCYDTYTS